MTDTLARLEAVIAARRAASPDSSYVAALHARGVAHVARKLGEEAVEAVVAAIAEDGDALVGEAADLLFHLLVLLGERDVPLAAVLAELDRREGVSGIAEKAARVAPATADAPPRPAPPAPTPEPLLAHGGAPAPRPRIRRG